MTDPPSHNPAANQLLRPARRRARLGWGGLFFILITVLLAVGAVNSQNNLLFWVFGLTVASVLVSGLFSGAGMMGLRVEPRDIPDAPVGNEARIPYAVRSVNRLFPVFAVNITETGLSCEPDRPTPACLLHIEPQGREPAHALWTPSRRGRHRFEGVRLESRFPFGLIIKSVEFRSPRWALVTPATVLIDPRIVESTGSGSTEHRTRRARRGAPGEYFGVRAYAPGDPIRAVAWKPTARRGELLVIEHAQQRGQSVWVHITRPRASDAQDETDHAHQTLLAERALAMALAVVRSGSCAQRPVGVWAPWAGVRLMPATGPHAEHRAARALAMVNLAHHRHADHAPPTRPGDTVIAIPLGPIPGRPDVTLDPERPEQWLAPGAILPDPLAELPTEHQRA